jgi:hypothetical protein
VRIQTGKISCVSFRINTNIAHRQQYELEQKLFVKMFEADLTEVIKMNI